MEVNLSSLSKIYFISFYHTRVRKQQDMTTVEELKAISEALRKDCAEKTETASVLKKASALYEAYLSSSGTVFVEPKVKAYFFEEFSTELVQCLSSLPALSKAEV